MHLLILQFIPVLPLLKERPDRNSASISNTSRSIHLPAPYRLLETSVECSEMLLVDLQCEINLSCCCSHRGQWVGMTPFLLVPMDIQGWCMYLAQEGREEQEAVEIWVQTLQSLKKNRQCEKCVYTSYKHWGPFPSFTRGFEHKTILTCSTTSRQW